MHDLARWLAARRLFIFDLDGTLADTSAVHAAAFAATLAPRGIVFDYGTIAGFTTKAAMQQLLVRAGHMAATDAELDMLVAAKRAAARDGLVDVREIAGAGFFLANASDGRRLALCTSAARATADATLAALGFADYFNLIVTADDVTQAKPAPDAFQAVLDQMRIPASDALVFEDSDAGLAAAHAAGIDAIRVGESGTDWASLATALSGVLK